MKEKKMKRIRQTIYEVMLNNQLDAYIVNNNNNTTGNLKESEKLFIYVEIINTSPKISYVFNAGGNIAVGRAVDSTICIQEAAVSRKHCEIFEYSGFVYVRNVSTSSRLAVKHGMKKEWLDCGESVPVYKKDRIYVGTNILQVILLQGQDYILN